MKALKGTKGSKRGLYKLVSKHEELPKMQEVDIMPVGGGFGVALRWRSGLATLLLKGGKGTLRISHFGDRSDKVLTVSMVELTELGLIEEV